MGNQNNQYELKKTSSIIKCVCSVGVIIKPLYIDTRVDSHVTPHH